MRNQLRDDIRLAAYAVNLGYKLVVKAFTDDGSPKDEIAFDIRNYYTNTKVLVWLTALGWRVGVEDPNPGQGQMIRTFLRPDPAADFFPSLKKALDNGVTR